jgi:hypothetical protein
MKTFTGLVFAVMLGMFFGGTAFARTCPKLIKEGRELLAKASVSKADATRIKNLLDESEKLHDSGDHGESVKKAKEALSLLKKK